MPDSTTKTDARQKGEVQPASSVETRAVGDEHTWCYVIHKRAGAHTTYELRLEVNGVFKSWIVAEQLPTTANESVLAVASDDQPLDLSEFEGVVASDDEGDVAWMLWDFGVFTAAGDDPGRAMGQGNIHFSLLGRKCEGEWTLLRAKADNGDRASWMLHKNREAQRRSAIRRAGRNRSALTGRTMRQIAAAKPKGRSKGARTVSRQDPSD